MATTKNKKTSGHVQPRKPVKRTKSPSNLVHMSRTKSSRRSHLSERDRHIFLIARRSIVAVIAVAMLAVILAMLTSFLNDTEALVTHKIETIAADYYENYFYPRIESYGTTDKTLAEIMSRYTETGFSKITLRQLLLFDSERYSDSASFLTKYCDPESTYIRIYPTDPFSRSDYHVDYHYSCNF